MSTIATWPTQAENWLDQRGKSAWVIAMVLGFIFFWPVGLALLAYMIWSKRMFNGSCGKQTLFRKHSFQSSGNSAFDAYKADTLRRLEDEQTSFEAFLQRLRHAKDKSEFDQFMDERASSTAQSDEDQDDDAKGRA
jgi:hypothetical protein